VGRTLWSAAFDCFFDFDFDFDLDFFCCKNQKLGRHFFEQNSQNKNKTTSKTTSTSKAADKSVRPTLTQN